MSRGYLAGKTGRYHAAGSGSFRAETTMANQRSDAELFGALKERLFTAVVGDVLDVMGHRRQFLPAGISPLAPKTRVVGRAMPVLEADVFCDGSPEAGGPLASKPFGLMLE